jgi:hypothetical protein
MIVMALASVAISCSESLDPQPLDYTQIISGKISKTWKFKSIAFKNEGDPDWKLTNPCWSDDTYTFYRDEEKKFEFESGITKCDPFEPRVTITDTWYFSNATATLSFVFPLLSDNALPFTVVDIDKNDLTLEIFFDLNGKQSYQMKFELDEEE